LNSEYSQQVFYIFSQTITKKVENQWSSQLILTFSHASSFIFNPRPSALGPTASAIRPPHLCPAQFKLTREMAELIGGGEHYRWFVDLCVRGFLAVRAHCEDVMAAAALMSRRYALARLLWAVESH
jgi:hypothetical protein